MDELPLLLEIIYCTFSLPFPEEKLCESSCGFCYDVSLALVEWAEPLFELVILFNTIFFGFFVFANIGLLLSVVKLVLTAVTLMLSDVKFWFPYDKLRFPYDELLLPYVKFYSAASSPLEPLLLVAGCAQWHLTSSCVRLGVT